MLVQQTLEPWQVAAFAVLVRTPQVWQRLLQVEVMLEAETLQVKVLQVVLPRLWLSGLSLEHFVLAHLPLQPWFYHRLV